ncbi:MAG: hypothetical protein ACRDZ3_19955 [Acidimicrobiia bacterium]
MTLIHIDDELYGPHPVEPRLVRRHLDPDTPACHEPRYCAVHDERYPTRVLQLRRRLARALSSAAALLDP